MIHLVTETMKMFVRMMDAGHSTDGAKAAFLDWCEHNDFSIVAGKEPGDMMPHYMLKSILEVALAEMVDRWEYVFAWSKSLNYDVFYLLDFPYELRLHPHAIWIAMVFREYTLTHPQADFQTVIHESLLCSISVYPKGRDSNRVGQPGYKMEPMPFVLDHETGLSQMLTELAQFMKEKA